MALTKMDCDTIAKLFREHGTLTDLLHSVGQFSIRSSAIRSTFAYLDSDIGKIAITQQRLNVEAQIRDFGINLIELEKI